MLSRSVFFFSKGTQMKLANLLFLFAMGCGDAPTAEAPTPAPVKSETAMEGVAKNIKAGAGIPIRVGWQTSWEAERSKDQRLAGSLPQ